MQTIRAADPPAQLGITLNLYAIDPASADPADLDAARRVDRLQNRLFLHPVLLGHYPEDVLADVDHLGGVGDVREGDLAVISSPLDFLGVNYYTRHVITASGSSNSETNPAGPTARVGSEFVGAVFRGLPRTDMDWEVDPDGLHAGRLPAQPPGRLPAGDRRRGAVARLFRLVRFRQF